MADGEVQARPRAAASAGARAQVELRVSWRTALFDWMDRRGVISGLIALLAALVGIVFVIGLVHVLG
jgi:hypothetical protein